MVCEEASVPSSKRNAVIEDSDDDYPQQKSSIKTAKEAQMSTVVNLFCKQQIICCPFYLNMEWKTQLVICSGLLLIYKEQKLREKHSKEHFTVLYPPR